MSNRYRTRERIAYWTMVTFIAALILLLALAIANPSLAAEEGDVGCVTVEVVHVDAHYTTIDIHTITEGMSATVVGHYLQMQYAHTPSSLDNVVSTDLDVWPTGTILTACTDYIATGVIPTGPGTAYEATIDTSGPPTVAVVSTLEPHPTILEAWITASGMVAA